ncbi:hypothetical protein [Candidatus Scalindua japonica]|nr:hypothetical protein [Candidatus Scalindua japonica]
MELTISLQEFDNINFTASDFIEKVDAEFKKIRCHKGYGYLVRERGKHKEIKKFIEEILPLQKYLQFLYRNGMRAETIKWQNGSQKGDAILNTDEIIEITVAEHKKEYIVRERENKGEPTFCAEGASKKNGVTESIPVEKGPEDCINAHTKMIEDVINKKLKKYDKINSLVIYLNQDGLLEKEEFNTVVKNIQSFDSLKIIDNVFICSFQYEAFVDFKKNTRKMLC